MQIDRIPPRSGPRHPPDGTSETASGVELPDGVPVPVELELTPKLDAEGRPTSRPGESEWTQPDIELPRGRVARLRAWALLLVACASLLGQGERFHLDPRFRSPGAVLETYWGALRDNDLTTVSECFTEPQASLPFPGMLWFLPPVDSLRIGSVQILSATSTVMLAMYEVRFTPTGSTRSQHFIATSQIQRIGREWRLVPPEGEASMPEWQPYPRPVDS